VRINAAKAGNRTRAVITAAVTVVIAGQVNATHRNVVLERKNSKVGASGSSSSSVVSFGTALCSLFSYFSIFLSERGYLCGANPLSGRYFSYRHRLIKHGIAHP
jgi:hypothetical protein